jgi:hypothetical protein
MAGKSPLALPVIFLNQIIQMDGPDYTLFRASGEYNGHIINEFKLMVPCPEVLDAEKKLRELEFIT